MNCQNCGMKNESNAEYCKSCGQPLNVTKNGQPSEKKKSVPKALIWIPLAAVFLVAIGVFGYRHFSGGRQTYEPCTVIAYQGEKMLWKETWNKYGDPEEGCYYSEDGENEYIEWKNEYDSKGRLIREECWENDKLDYYLVYVYSGKTRSGKQYDEDDELLTTSEAILNGKGLPVQIESYDDEGNHFGTISYEYDNHGYATRIVNEKDASNSLDYDKLVRTREYTYKHGHPISAIASSKNYLENKKIGSIYLERWEFVY